MNFWLTGIYFLIKDNVVSLKQNSRDTTILLVLFSIVKLGIDYMYIT